MSKNLFKLLPPELIRRIAGEFSFNAQFTLLQVGAAVTLRYDEFEWLMWNSHDAADALLFKSYYPNFNHPIAWAQTLDGRPTPKKEYCRVAYNGTLHSQVEAREGWNKLLAWARANGAPWTDQVRDRIVHLDVPAGVRGLPEQCFYDCQRLHSINLPQSLLSVGNFALSGCGNLIQVHLQDGVTELGEGIFMTCTSLTDAHLPDGPTKLRGKTFNGCLKLRHVRLPDSLLSMGDLEFNGCESLEGVHLPNSIRTIGSDAFMGCIRMKDLIIPSQLTQIANTYTQNMTPKAKFRLLGIVV